MKWQRYAYWLPAIMMALSAIAKLAFSADGREALPENPLSNKMIPLALLECCCLVLYLLPRTWHIGFFLVCAYLGGAMAANMITGLGSPLIPALLLTLFWIGSYFRDSKLFTQKP